MKIAPDEPIRNRRTAKQKANQEARETRDLELLQIDNNYIPTINWLERQRREEMRRCWQKFLRRRKEIELDYADDPPAPQPPLERPSYMGEFTEEPPLLLP